MPQKRKQGDDPGSSKKSKSSSSKQRKTPAKKRAPSKRDVWARKFGETVGKSIKLTDPWPKFEMTKGIKEDAFKSLLSGETVKDKEKFGSSFRGLGPDMDEFFSTATAREFVTGLLGDKKWSEYTKVEQAYMGELVDLISAIRAPTRYVGYSVSGEIMQHPTSRPQAYFEDPYLTASKHSELDNARRDYIQRAAEKAIEGGEGAREIVLSAGRAAIEFTLNNFMAPSSASTVHPFSKMKGLKVTEEKILEQVRWREFLKDFYVDVLGGKLRPLTGPEKDEESLVRAWYRQASDYPSLPPSPRRSTDTSKFGKQQQDEDEAIELAEITPRAVLLDQSGSDVFGQSLAPSNENLSSNIDVGPQEQSTISRGSSGPAEFDLSGYDPSYFGSGSLDPFGSNLHSPSAPGNTNISSPLAPTAEVEMDAIPINFDLPV